MDLYSSPHVREQTETLPQIIGGVFGLQIGVAPSSSRPPFLTGDEILLVNARSAILLLIERLSPARVWMPSYLCRSMLSGARQRGVVVRFFEVNYDLHVSSLAWLDEIGPGDLVVLIDYFGFPCDAFCALEATRRGAVILEDACPALLSKDVGRFSDYVVYSPRKFLGVPDGGILSSKKGLNGVEVKLEGPPAQWWLKSVFATVLRREFDLHGGDRHWFELFQEAEAEAPLGHYAMSELSRALLIQRFDYLSVAAQRVANYHILADRLPHLAIFPDLPAGVVPLGFPIRIKNRDGVRQALFEHQIYPTLHWPIQDIVPQTFSESHRLAADIMTLPCDQRYSAEDMERMANTLLKELSRGEVS